MSSAWVPALHGLNAGDLDRQITINQQQVTQDATGAAITTWVLFAVCWAKYVPLSGAELYRAQQWEAKTTAKLIIRYRPGVSTKMQVIFDGKTYDITDINEIGRRVGLAITCYARSE